MTTGRINQVATSRAPQTPRPRTRCPHDRRGVPTAPALRPHRARVRAECFRAHNRSLMMISVAKVPLPAETRALRPQYASRGASCCLLAVLLERCCPQAPGRAPPLRAVETARGASAGAGGKSAFGARRAQLHSPTLLHQSAKVVAAAFSRDRCVVNAGHCLRTRCFLRRPRSK